MMTIMTDKSPRTNYAGSLQEAIADTWREKLSNVNVAIRNVNHFNLKKQQTGRSSEVKSATYLYFCFNVNFYHRAILCEFLKENCDPFFFFFFFFRIKVFMQE